MAKVIMTCGRICSGKSTYAEQIRTKNSAAILSVDEIMLALFDQNIGDKHDEYVERTEKFLFDKSVKLVETGINVILDWGFWTKEERRFARGFYNSRNIECEFHYIDISDEEWKLRLDKRNKSVLAGKSGNYFVDDGLAKKFASIFEMPGKEEIDVWVDF